MKWIIILIFILIGYTASAQQEIELCPGSRNTFTYWSNASTNTGGWLWVLNGDTVSNGSSVRITYRDTGFYLIVVRYKDECGNPMNFYTVNVKKCPESAIFFPNAFTPNGDGLNDSWSPIPFKITEIRWMVYNRWGEKVYETNRIGDKWDGRHRGETQGTFNFVFMCWWKGIDGKTGFKKGNVIQIR
jgi:gliding motility-associated-like protein